VALAIAIALLVLGSLLFHFLSPWQLSELASNWGAMDDTIAITFAVTGLVFVAVNGFMAWAIWRYRQQPGRRAEYQPESKRLEAWLTGLTTVGIAALLAPGLFVWVDFVDVPEEAHQVEVVGQQWHWSYRFPGEDGVLGAVQTARISEQNPFGMVDDDPAGDDDVLVVSPRLVLPVDRPVELLLRSKDVIHNFTVAQWRTKMDLVPGQISYMWLEPTRTGRFDVLCEELCGIGHFAMQGLVEVVPESEFRDWLDGHPTWAEYDAHLPGDPGAGRAHYASCVACHGPEGAGNEALNAPRLAGLSPWYVRRQLELFRSGARGGDPDDTTGAQMVPFANSLSGPAAIADVAAYVGTLPAPEAAVAAQGDPDRGRRLYRTCANCHGEDGEGGWSFNAPALAGSAPWYLKAQLEKFRSGVRGAHPEDDYGPQMRAMARTLVGEASVDDVVAWISTLPGRAPDASAVAAAPDAGGGSTAGGSD
jgi:cytochrome c oxidase subunit 2